MLLGKEHAAQMVRRPDDLKPGVRGGLHVLLYGRVRMARIERVRVHVAQYAVSHGKTPFWSGAFFGRAACMSDGISSRSF